MSDDDIIAMFIREAIESLYPTIPKSDNHDGTY